MKRLDDFIQSLSDEERKILADKLNKQYNVTINVNPDVGFGGIKRIVQDVMDKDFERYDRLRGI
jgi:hypothetical protein